MWGSVVEKGCGEVLQGRVVKKCWRRVVEKCCVQTCCREVL